MMGGCSLQATATSKPGVFNHSNLYVNADLINPGTDVSTTNSFAKSNGDFVSGVIASFRDYRQIVLALKLIF